MYRIRNVTAAYVFRLLAHNFCSNYSLIKCTFIAILNWNEFCLVETLTICSSSVVVVNCWLFILFLCTFLCSILIISNNFGFFFVGQTMHNIPMSHNVNSMVMWRDCKCSMLRHVCRMVVYCTENTTSNSIPETICMKKEQVRVQANKTHTTVSHRLPVIIRFEWTSFIQTHVFGLFVTQLGEMRIERGQM